MSQLVLSLFPGVGLFDRAFEEYGFCVVRGPDLIHGGNIRAFAGIKNRFDGIIAGSPCQGFSAANRHRNNPDHPSVRNSRQMLQETMRVIHECAPTWFVIENVPGVPDVCADGYTVQRIAISDWECGGVQLRSRAIQFGHSDGWKIRPKRVNDLSRNRKKGRPPEAVTTRKEPHTDFPDHCRKQGLTEPLVLPGWSQTAKFAAVGNGVPLTIGRAIAAAVIDVGPPRNADCLCECGRQCSGRKKTATDSCRKRWELLRKKRAFSSEVWVDRFGFHDG